MGSHGNQPLTAAAFAGVPRVWNIRFAETSSIRQPVQRPLLLERLFGAEGDDRPERVVVADGGSDDRTREIARAAGCELVLSARGRGF